MIIICDINTIALPKNFPKNQSTIVTIGNFDGVHIGHQTLLKTMCKHASDHSAKTIVITFEPHPQKILKGSKHKPLTTPKDKFSLLKKLGIDLIFQLQFSLQVASMDTKTFIQEILLNKLQMKELVLGHDFSMGHNQSGTKDVINILGKTLSFTVTTVPPTFIQEDIISSSSIRKKLEQGMVSSATHMLGHPYTITGTIIAGEQRGQKLGFPTINLKTPHILIPLQGVYVTFVTLQTTGLVYCKPIQGTKNTFLGVTNIGIQPTFRKKKTALIETHILSFTGSLYGETISLSFLERLRAERSFQDTGLLITQIKTDILEAKKILKNTFGLVLE